MLRSRQKELDFQKFEKNYQGPAGVINDHGLVVIEPLGKISLMAIIIRTFIVLEQINSCPLLIPSGHYFKV